MTEIQAIKESVELWTWLVDNFPAMKRKHPDFESKYSKYSSRCPACEYYNYCDLCPLKDCCSATSDYAHRADFINCDGGSPRRAFEATRSILKKMEKKLKELEGE